MSESYSKRHWWSEFLPDLYAIELPNLCNRKPKTIDELPNYQPVKQTYKPNIQASNRTTKLQNQTNQLKVRNHKQL